MSLTKVNYIDNSTIITAKNLNDIQDNVILNSELVKKVAPRNLLDNSDFTNPVNQRGQASYTGSSTTTYTYTIDRWCVGNSQSVVTVSSGCVVFSCLDGSTNAYPKQLVENMGGKTVTGAICLKDGSVYIVNAVMPSTAPTALTGIATASIGSDGTAITIACEKNSFTLRFQLTIPTGKSLSVKWAALYEGEYTAETLPEYQSKGYGAELAECQRQLRRWANTQKAGIAVATSETTAIGYIFMPEMRVNPTITFENLTCSSDARPVSDVKLSIMSNNMVEVTIYTSATFVTGSAYTIRPASGGYLQLSAEM